MGRKSDAVLFMRYSGLAGVKGFWIDWLHLVNALCKDRELWNAARIAYYEMMARNYPHLLCRMPTARFNDQGVKVN